MLLFESLFRFALKDSFDGRFDYGFSSGVGIQKIGQERVEFRRTAGRKFWPQNYAVQKEISTYRIIVIGDSIARGPSLESSYAKLLETQLGKTTAHRLEFWNLSIPGYGAERKKIVLQDVLRYQPDMILIHSGISNEFEDERDKKLSNQYKGWHPQYWPMKSYLLRWLDELQQQRIKPKLLSPEIRSQTMLSDTEDENMAAKNPDNVARWRKSFVHHTQETLNLLIDEKIPYFFIPRIVLSADKTQLDDEGLYEILNTLIPSSNLIDLKSELIEYRIEDLYSKDLVHLTNEGHAAISKILTSKLRHLIQKE